MAPVTIAGALVQQNAEALAGITLAQIVRAGAPVVYGSFTTNVDMRSGAPGLRHAGICEGGQISGPARAAFGLPFRSSNVTTASNIVDAQAAYESEMSLWGAIMGGCQSWCIRRGLARRRAHRLASRSSSSMPRCCR